MVVSDKGTESPFPQIRPEFFCVSGTLNRIISPLSKSYYDRTDHIYLCFTDCHVVELIQYQSCDSSDGVVMCEKWLDLRNQDSSLCSSP